MPELQDDQASADLDASSPDTKDPESGEEGATIKGVDVVRASLHNLPDQPGVYRMVDRKGEVLYVGKARNLKRRVANYTQFKRLPNRLQRMVAATATMEFITTHTETEALLLEANLIKRYLPRFNILLRDDKSFPYIMITNDHMFPRLVKHRGKRDGRSTCYGPFASAGAVTETIIALQRAFLLRNCTDTMFASRSRPCLQYHIKRCTAPCVDRVDAALYREQVEAAQAFLEGRSRDVQADFAHRMSLSAEALDYEAAARWRDRIRALSAVQTRQSINVEGLIDDADVIAACQDGGQTSVQVFFFRGGRNYGNRAWFPQHDRQQNIEDVLAAFVIQFYENKTPPPLMLLSHKVPEQDLIEEALGLRAGCRVALAVPQRGDKKRLVDHALSNARTALARRLADSATQTTLLTGVAHLFALNTPPSRIEVYDNSHVQGTNAIGAMIVSGPTGFEKAAYRKFNIRDAKAGDDPAMMAEVLRRRFGRALKENLDHTGPWPNLILIDGGPSQLASARRVLTELGVEQVPVVAIAKGPDRDAGRERFFLADKAPFQLDPRDPILYFLQRLRDEAHRFAIDTHRARRNKAMVRSELDDVSGIGPARKRALLHHFGSARAIANAGQADLESVPGINRTVAKKIYEYFHSSG